MISRKLNRRIEIKRATYAKDAYNESIETWVTFATLWASYQPLSDGERMKASENAAEKMARFQIRYSTTSNLIDAKDRVRFENSDWDITHIKPINLRDGFEISATARAEKP